LYVRKGLADKRRPQRGSNVTGHPPDERICFRVHGAEGLEAEGHKPNTRSLYTRVFVGLCLCALRKRHANREIQRIDDTHIHDKGCGTGDQKIRTERLMKECGLASGLQVKFFTDGLQGAYNVMMSRGLGEVLIVDAAQKVRVHKERGHIA
jgi:hypothetical protein